MTGVRTSDIKTKQDRITEAKYWTHSTTPIFVWVYELGTVAGAATMWI